MAVDKKRLAILVTLPPNGLPEAGVSGMLTAGLAGLGDVVSVFTMSVTKNTSTDIVAYADAEVPAGQSDAVTAAIVQKAINLITLGSNTSGSLYFVCTSVLVSPR